MGIATERMGSWGIAPGGVKPWEKSHWLVSMPGGQRPPSLPQYQHHCSELDPALGRKHGCRRCQAETGWAWETQLTPGWWVGIAGWGSHTDFPELALQWLPSLLHPFMASSNAALASPSKSPSPQVSPKPVSQKNQTDPWRPRQEATTQSIELQEQIFFHAHVMSQPNRSTQMCLYRGSLCPSIIQVQDDLPNHQHPHYKLLITVNFAKQL